MVEKKTYLSETVLEISWKAILHNLTYFKKKLNPATKIMLMLKASAYGNGAIQLAKRLEKEKVCDYFAVAYVSEGIALRKNNISLPIMVLNPAVDSWKMMIKHCLEPEIHNLTLFQSFSKFILATDTLKKEGFPIHLKFNTGMNRLGIDSNELSQLIKLLENNSSLQVKSIMTHLSSASLPAEDEFTKAQFAQFETIKKSLAPYLPAKTLAHVLNTHGIERFAEHQYNMVRLGIGMYGSSSIKNLKEKLIPICKLKASISAIRRVKKGDSISYSRSGRAPSDGFIATLALGYADGLNRNLGNGNWKVEINDKLYPTIGNICMDLSMVFLGNDHVDLGTEAIIFGGHKTIHEFAKAQKTITYEALTNIGGRVKKVLIN